MFEWRWPSLLIVKLLTFHYSVSEVLSSDFFVICKQNPCFIEIAKFGNRDKNYRLATNFRRGSIRFELVEQANAQEETLYIDRVKIINFPWQLSTPLSRTSHVISAPLKISARVWSAKFHAGASCREKSFEATTQMSDKVCVHVWMHARRVRFTWFNSLPWLRYLDFPALSCTLTHTRANS